MEIFSFICKTQQVGKRRNSNRCAGKTYFQHDNERYEKKQQHPQIRHSKHQSFAARKPGYFRRSNFADIQFPFIESKRRCCEDANVEKPYPPSLVVLNLFPN